MKRSFCLSLALALSLAALSNTAVSAQGSMGATPDPTGIYREAGAQPEQLQKIRDLAKDYEQSAMVKAERAKNLLKKMQDLSLQPNPDEKAVLSTQDEINSLQAEMANSRIKIMLKIRTILSEEQRQHLVELMKQRMQSASNQ
jgi:Spy/CpxP family protein refolding chaperone